MGKAQKESGPKFPNASTPIMQWFRLITGTLRGYYFQKFNKLSSPEGAPAKGTIQQITLISFLLIVEVKTKETWKRV